MSFWSKFKDWLNGANCGIHANVQVTHIRDGKVLSNRHYKNIVVNGGLDYLKTLIGNDVGAGGVKWIGLSSAVNAPAATDTDLGATILTADGLERAAGEYTVGDTGVFTCGKLFTLASGGPKVINSVGLYYEDAPDKLFAGVAVNTTTLQDLDAAQVTWTVRFTSV